MKLAIGVTFLTLTSCFHSPRPISDYEFPFGKAVGHLRPFHENPLGGRLHRDIWFWRDLDNHLDAAAPASSGLAFSHEGIKCTNDNSSIVTVKIGPGGGVLPESVKTIAYYCAKENKYYYHVSGGPKNLDAWLGPYVLPE